MPPGVLLLLTAVTLAGPTLQPLPVTEILQRYIRGESVGDALSPHLRTPDAFSDFLRDFKREARKIATPIAAAFTLEAASLAFQETPMEALRKDLPNALAILEVGCATLRDSSQAPSDFEIRWQVLAADLITSSTRRKSGSAETSWYHSYIPYDSHFKHMRRRNDSDPRLALSFARYEQAQFYVWRLMDGFSLVNAAQGVVPRGYEGAARLKIVVTTLERLLDHPDFADEARVRSGDALLYLGRDKEAFALLTDRTFRDGKWDYIWRLIRARTFLQGGNTADAARQYEAAIRIDPRARAVNLTLAGLAYLAGQHDVATRLAKAAGESSEPDPWMAYMYPGAASWNARLAALRKETRGE